MLKIGNQDNIRLKFKVKYPITSILIWGHCSGVTIIREVYYDMKVKFEKQKKSGSRYYEGFFGWKNDNKLGSSDHMGARGWPAYALIVKHWVKCKGKIMVQDKNKGFYKG